MAATSKHWGDVYLWICKVIDSCKTEGQWETAHELFILYAKKHPVKKIGDDMYELHKSLRNRLNYKFYEVDKSL